MSITRTYRISSALFWLGLLLPSAHLSADNELPGRVVTIGAAVTETVFALGEGERVVAVDLSSTYPPEVERLPQVGYIRNLSPEGVLASRPDLVIASGVLGPPAAQEALRRVSVPVLWCPEPGTVAALETTVRAIGQRLDRKEKAEEILAGIQASIAEAAQASEQWPERPRVLFFLQPPGANRAGMVAGSGTAAEGLIQLAGGLNAAEDFSGYQPMGAEAIFAVGPDIILIGESEEHGAGPGALDELRGHPVLAHLSAVKEGRMHMVALEDLAFGPRLGEAVAHWHALLAEAAQQ